MSAKKLLEKSGLWRKVEDSNLTKKVMIEFAEAYHTEQLRLHGVVKSLPSKEEILFEPISNALYATGRFTIDQCTDLTNGIIQYIDDDNISVAKK